MPVERIMKTELRSIEKKHKKKIMKGIYEIQMAENNRDLLRYLVVAISKKKHYW